MEIRVFGDRRMMQRPLRPFCCHGVLGRALTMGMAFTILLAFGTAKAGAVPSLTTPEETIAFFIDRVRAEDYEGALQATAAKEMERTYDYEQLIEWLLILPPSHPYLPSEYPLFAIQNRLAMESLILRQLSWMALSVVLPVAYSPFLEMRTLLSSEVGTSHVVSDMNPQRFLGLEIIEISASVLLQTERTQAALSEEAAIHGADAATARAVLYRIDGSYYVGGFKLLRYGTTWRVASLVDPMIRQPSTGALVRVEGPEEFRTMLE